MREAVDDIMVTLNEAASEGGMVGGMVESIAESIGRVSVSVFPSRDSSAQWNSVVQQMTQLTSDVSRHTSCWGTRTVIRH